MISTFEWTHRNPKGTDIGMVIGMEYLLGNEEILMAMPKLASKEPFSLEILEFCGNVSKELMRMPEAKRYPDVVTLGFWLRKGSMDTLRKKFLPKDDNLHLGRGMVFHIAPSNVPVNFAYSLFTGLLCGNANVVRIPSKDFLQVGIIIEAIKKALQEFPDIASYICLVRYGHDRGINDRLSTLCDVRVIWGGDATIAEIRKSSLRPRATEITFADRFSLAVIDTAVYSALGKQEKEKIVRGFYNDTYLTDQNACTSPKVVVWLDSMEEDGTVEVRKEFWTKLREIIEKEYIFQDIQGVNKLTKMYLLAAEKDMHIRKSALVKEADNRLFCVEVDHITAKITDHFDNAGYFLEYVTKDILELLELCSDDRCQTIGYVGEKERFFSLIRAGIKGIDRVVPVGKTMDFDLIWDGYHLVERLIRTIVL